MSPVRGGARPVPGGGIPPGARRPNRHHRQWSRTVWLLKLLLPLAAFSLVAFVIAWSQLSGKDLGFKVGLSRIAPDEARTLRMVNARFAGMNHGTRPYLVTAEQAIQDRPDAELIRLVNPKGDITTAGGAWIALTAPTGTYHQERKKLDLAGGVSLFHDSGLEFTSPTAHIDLEASTAQGNDPVTGHGPASDITAEGFRVLDEGKRVIFTGRAKLVLYPRDKASSRRDEAPSEATR
ncbi:MAG TPA: LPS export ABC transporter periplasmic protein LptC [Alphaproteobacteria bacterium]|jgi:lipopolysaccharide export system protein LptC